MPRVRQLKVEDASSSGHGIGKAHIEIQSWRDDVLAPACAKRGRCIGDFLLVAGEPNKLNCSVCRKSFMGKNEKDKHRHELSLSHRRACAHELQLTDEELGADKSAQPMELAKWVCRECHIIFGRPDVLKRHHKRTGHSGNMGVGVVETKRRTKTRSSEDHAPYVSSSSSTPSIPTPSLASGAPASFWRCSPLAPAAPEYSPSMFGHSFLGPTPPPTEFVPSLHPSIHPTPASSTTGLLDCDPLFLLLQRLPSSGPDLALGQSSTPVSTFSLDAGLLSASPTCTQDFARSFGGVHSSDWENSLLLGNNARDSSTQESSPDKVFQNIDSLNTKDWNFGQLDQWNNFDFDDYISY